MKKIAYIAIGIALLVALFFAGKEIYWQKRISNAVKTLSQRYVYVSGPRNDPPYVTPEDVRLRQVECIKAFQLFYHIASDRRIKKEMYSPSPSMRVYAYLAQLIKTNDVDFDYLSEQMEFRDEVKFTGADFFVEYDTFACDAMVYCASMRDSGMINIVPTINSSYDLTKEQADLLLNRMYEELQSVNFRNKEVVYVLMHKIGE
jgi:hypothetical protein